MNPLLLILLLSFLGSRCAPKKELNGGAIVTYDSANAVLPYHLDSPDTTFYLSEELREISGLSLSPSPSKLSALQDEIGQLYLLHKNSGKADPPFVFKQDGGDFEGLEWKGDTAYAVRSKGTIYEIIHPGSEGELVLKYETGLSKDTNDVEGLCLSHDRKQLWLACKGPKEGVFTRHVLAFDLKTHQLQPQPVLSISLRDVLAYMDTAKDIKRIEKLRSMFTPDAKEFIFGPSGIAIQPQSGDIYIISSLGKTLFVLGKEGKLKHIEKLEKEILPQPEGITFDADGTLYIASEGRDGAARLCIFKLK